MSWIVQHIINNHITIEANALKTNDFDDSQYQDMIVIDEAIATLQSSGMVTDYELEVLDYVKAGGKFSTKIKTIKGDRGAQAKRYYDVCDRIAFFLGGYYTNDGYLDYMKSKYKLGDEELEVLRQYMTGNHKNKLLKNKLLPRRK